MYERRERNSWVCVSIATSKHICRSSSKLVPYPRKPLKSTLTAYCRAFARNPEMTHHNSHCLLPSIAQEMTHHNSHCLLPRTAQEMTHHNSHCLLPRTAQEMTLHNSHCLLPSIPQQMTRHIDSYCPLASIPQEMAHHIDSFCLQSSKLMNEIMIHPSSVLFSGCPFKHVSSVSCQHSVTPFSLIQPLFICLTSIISTLHPDSSASPLTQELFSFCT